MVLSHRTATGTRAPLLLVARAGIVAATALAPVLISVAAQAAPAASRVAETVARLPASRPFELGPATSAGGGVAVDRSGDVVVVYDASSTQTAVCVIRPGGRRCAHVTKLRPLSHDSTFGVPQVFLPSRNHVVVLQNTCCDTAPAGDDLLYTSSNGGRTFAAPVRVGSLGVDAATLIGSTIAFTVTNDTSGSQVESIPVKASGPPASIATARSKQAFSVAIGQYKGGVLVGSDFIGTRTTTTYVEYAPRGKNFNASASYHSVAVFAGEHLLAMSGHALLTVQASGNHNAVLLRLFNGRSFGLAHAVPHTKGGGPEWFTVCMDPTGRVHVFSVRGLYRGYDLIEESTSTGTRWSQPADLGSAIQSNAFDAGLNRSGRGLVLGTGPAWAYPVP